jgi:hypothetical protein
LAQRLGLVARAINKGLATSVPSERETRQLQ